MSRPLLNWIVAVNLCLQALSASAAAPLQNGWVQWQTASAEQAPSYCCQTWDKRGTGQPESTGCDLNEDVHGISTVASDGSQKMKVFAKFEAGKLVLVHSLSLSCEVRNASQAKALGDLSTAQSLAILTGTPVRESADRHDQSMQMMSVALHPGAQAQAWLQQAFASPDSERRQDALFWMGQVRAQASKSTLQQALLQNADPGIRRHACFVVAESGLSERFDWLVQAAKRDTVQSVRHDAWFWFGQSQPKQAEQVLEQAMTEAKNRSTRDHLVFVLSQLPAPRGTDALIRLLSDRQMQPEIRKQALFWLAQSKDPRALAALDQYL